MMIAEFTERTGVVPTDWEYKEIEKLYYTFDGGKDEFCKAWVWKARGRKSCTTPGHG